MEVYTGTAQVRIDGELVEMPFAKVAIREANLLGELQNTRPYRTAESYVLEQRMDFFGQDVEQLTVGEMIRILRGFPQYWRCKLFGAYGYGDVNLNLYVDSSRSSYANLALGFDAVQAPTVAEVLERLEQSIGSWQFGWKGGEYLTERSTKVDLGNRGDSTGLGFVRIFSGDYGEDVVYLEVADVWGWHTDGK